MKYLLIALALTGCAAGGNPGQPAWDSTALRSYRDTSLGVVCYRVVGFEGLSCLQVEEPK